MDEKGIQMGGGRKNHGRRYYHMRELKQKNCYRIHSDSLELVTVVECVSAAGATMPVSFVLAEGPLPDCTDLENVGRLVHYLPANLCSDIFFQLCIVPEWLD